MIKIVDYGMGNLRSVQKGFEKVGAEAVVCSKATDLKNTDKLVLPGVGAFRDAMRELKSRDLLSPVRDHIAADKPFLGICLGLQLLLETSYEDGQWEGFGVIPGDVVRFENQLGLKIPHMGWNRLDVVASPPLLEGIGPDAHFYFVHSYYVAPTDDSVIAARTTHGTEFVSMIARGNLFATQFHPEKSQRAGLKILENFAAL